MLVAVLLVLMAVATASMLAAFLLRPEAMGRGRGAGGYFDVLLLGSAAPSAAVIAALALVVYYILLPEIPYTPTTGAKEGGGVKKKRSSGSAEETPLEVALRFLEDDERRVCEALRDAGGTLLQKEISWKTGFSKVKTHRIVYRLAKRNVIEVEKYFNTNRVSLKTSS